MSTIQKALRAIVEAAIVLAMPAARAISPVAAKMGDDALTYKARRAIIRAVVEGLTPKHRTTIAGLNDEDAQRFIAGVLFATGNMLGTMETHMAKVAQYGNENAAPSMPGPEWLRKLAKGEEKPEPQKGQAPAKSKEGKVSKAPVSGKKVPPKKSPPKKAAASK